MAEGLDPNEAYSYKQRLEACEKNLAELDRKEEQLEYEKANKPKEEDQAELEKVEEKPEISERLR